MLKLSKRLLCAVAEINDVDAIADIGTDHGQLIIYALKKNLAKRAFAVDISEKSLAKARVTVNEFGLEDRVSFFVGDGLSPLPEIPDIVVIAGIGGNETVNILNNVSMDTKFVFIPHNDAHVLREYLCNNGYGIEKDYIVHDNKFYAVIVASRGHTEYTRSQIMLGANNPPSEDFFARIVDRKNRIEKILHDSGAGVNSLQPEMREEYEEIKKCIK